MFTPSHWIVRIEIIQSQHAIATFFEEFGAMIASPTLIPILKRNWAWDAWGLLCVNHGYMNGSYSVSGHQKTAEIHGSEMIKGGFSVALLDSGVREASCFATALFQHWMTTLG